MCLNVFFYNLEFKYESQMLKLGMSSRGGVTSSRTVTSSSSTSTRSGGGGFEMPIHISIGGSSADFSKPKTPRPRTMPFSCEDPFASSSLKMTSAEEMMSQMQAQMQVQMQQMQKSLQVQFELKLTRLKFQLDV
jgi:hypothetical protein